MTTVLLTPAQVITAALAGVRRHVTNIYRDHAYGLDTWSFDEHIQGAIGEMVVAKHFNLYWEAVVRDPWNEIQSDVGKGLEIRTTGPNRRLIVRSGDPDDKVFIHVAGERLEWTITGWLLGWEAKQDQWLTNAGNNRPPAWFVPSDELHPIEKLAIPGRNL